MTFQEKTAENVKFHRDYAVVAYTASLCVVAALAVSTQSTNCCVCQKSDTPLWACDKQERGVSSLAVELGPVLALHVYPVA